MKVQQIRHSLAAALLVAAVLLVTAFAPDARAQNAAPRYRSRTGSYSGRGYWRKSRRYAPAAAAAAAAGSAVGATAAGETATAPEAAPAEVTGETGATRATADEPDADPPAQPSSAAANASTNSAAPPSAAAAPPMTENDRLEFMNDRRADAPGETGSAGGIFVRTLGALLIVVGIAASVGYGLRRFGGARFGAVTEGSPAVAVLSSVALGDRRSLAVIRFKDRTLLVGSTPHALTLLAEEYDDAHGDKSSATTIAAAPATPAPGRSVADLLDLDGAPAPQVFADELAAAARRDARPNAWGGQA